VTLPARRGVNPLPASADHERMGSFDYDLICIGCGPAGEKAATQAAYFRKRVAVVEARAQPGGAMVNTGTVPSKALRETALVCSAFHRAPLPGHDLNVDHNLSVVRFMAHRHQIEQQEHDRIEASFDRHAIDVLRGFGRIADGHTVLVRAPDGAETRHTARFILIGTGSSPLRPEHVPFDHPRVVDADGVLELERLPRSMIIVGAGVIGCEYASIFAEIDVAVTLINPRPDVLSFLDHECRDHLLRAMRQRSIETVFGRSVVAVKPGDASVRVELDDGAALAGDILLWAAGRASNTRGLGLEQVGIEMGERGLVKVDAHYRTSVPSVFAAGDVIGFPALAATSMEQGRIAACAMFGLGFKEAIKGVMPLGIYTIPAVSMVGTTEQEAVASGAAVVVGRALYRHNARGRMLGDQEGLLKCVFDAGSRRLLGACCVGESATELIHLAQSVLHFGGGIDYFIDACFNYPSLCELYKYAAYNALQHLAHSRGAEQELGAAARVA
jgi:NAD(P) transhydrogenase